MPPPRWTGRLCISSAPMDARRGANRQQSSRQTTLESCAKVVKYSGFSALVFTLDDLLRLQTALESGTPQAKLEALRVLSTLVISVADLEASLIGRSVNRLARSDTEDEHVKRIAGKLLLKWRELVQEARLAQTRR